MVNQSIQEKIKKLPYFSSRDMSVELYERFSRLKEALESRDENSPHLLNKKNVTGIWYLTDLAFDEGEPHIIVRVDKNNPELRVGSYTRIMLHGEIFDIIYNDVNYDYEEEINQPSMLLREIEHGRVLTIYDKERN